MQRSINCDSVDKLLVIFGIQASYYAARQSNSGGTLTIELYAMKSLGWKFTYSAQLAAAQ